MDGKRNLKTSLVMSLFLLAIVSTAGAEIIYVDADASTSGNGTTWGTAYKYLQDALLADAISGDQVWVAAGTYKPDQDEGGNVTPGNRNDSFKLINGVGIYGGFPSGGTWEDRDPNTYETILSGDIGIPDANNDNSYHVVVALGMEETAVLEGFAITSGNANGTAVDQKWGGGMLNISSDPMVTNCTFTGNSAFNYGGGMFNYNRSSPTVTNCTFTNNTALGGSGGGGGMYNEDRSNPMVTNCTFTGNEAAHGGGMLNYNNSNPTVSNCTFCDNIANIDGGGMRNNSSNLTVTNCTFTGNSASKDGGGMDNGSSEPTVTNCTFSGNEAVWDGGGMCNVSGSHTVTNCILWGNSDSGGTDESAQIHNLSSTPVINYCCVQGWTGGGTGNIDDDPVFIDPNGLDGIPNTADDEEGYVHLRGYSPCINAGDPGGDYSGQVDIDNQPRVAYGRVDMGADEVFPIAGDFEPDGDVDFADFARFANHWLAGL